MSCIAPIHGASRLVRALRPICNPLSKRLLHMGHLLDTNTARPSMVDTRLLPEKRAALSLSKGVGAILLALVESIFIRGENRDPGRHEWKEQPHEKLVLHRNRDDMRKRGVSGIYSGLIQRPPRVELFRKLVLRRQLEKSLCSNS